MRHKVSKINVLELFEFVREELEGNNLDEDVWKKAMAESGQVEAIARDRYKSIRIKQLKNALSLEGEQPQSSETEEDPSPLEDLVIETASNGPEKGRFHLLCLIVAGFLIPLLVIAVTAWSFYYTDDELEIVTNSSGLQASTVVTQSTEDPKSVDVAERLDAQVASTPDIEEETLTLVDDAELSTIIEKEFIAEEMAEPIAETESWMLTVRPEPVDAVVQIVNIQPQYSDGMRLPGGAYRIKVSKEGHIGKDVWMHLDKDLIYTVTLSPEAHVVKTSPAMFELTIRTNPEGSQVGIINSDRDYHDGMLLRGGEYQIYVAKEGYESMEKSVTLRANTIFSAEVFTLQKPQQVFIGSEPLKFAEASVECTERGLRVPTFDELDGLIRSGSIASHKDGWFWTSERSGMITYRVIQNNVESLTMRTDLTQYYFVHCVQ